jgi:tetratricopeptide (TPR) repeat protein
MSKPVEIASGRLPLLAPLLLLAVTVLVHARGLGGEFVYDDHRFIVSNEAIRDLGNVPRFFVDPEATARPDPLMGWRDIYRPLRTLSFAVDHALFGDGPFGFHVVSLLWHLAAVLLAWLLARRLLGDPWLAALAAAVFALHPAQVQSVAWVSSRGDLMAGAFLLGACLLLLRNEVSSARLTGGAVLYALALLSKESAVALLGIVVVHDLLLAEEPRFRGRSLAVLGAVTLLYLLVRGGVATGQVEFEARSLPAVGSGALLAVGTALIPVALTPWTGDILRISVLGVPAGWVLLVLAVLAVALLLLLGRRFPGVAFALLWFAVAYAPVSGLVPLKSLAELRFLYLPLLGIGLLAGLVARALPRRAVLAAVAVPVLLGLLSWREARLYRTDVDLWLTAVERQERVLGAAGPGAYSNLGIVLLAAGRDPEALPVLRRAWDMLPTARHAINLALGLEASGELEEASRLAQMAAELEPKNPGVRHRCGELLLHMGRYVEAAVHLARAAELSPRVVEIRLSLARALLATGRAATARGHLEAALDLEPREPRLWLLLGNCHSREGRPREALAAYATAVDIDPDSHPAWLAVGRALLDLGEYREAMFKLDRARRLRPDDPAARAEMLAASAGLEALPFEEIRRLMVGYVEKLRHRGDTFSIVAVLSRPPIRALRDPLLEDNLVMALLERGENEAALRELRQLVERRKDSPLLVANLGLLEARAGRPEVAIPHLERAIELDPYEIPLRMPLARAYRAVGREEDARRMVREILAPGAASTALRQEAEDFLAER